MQYPRFYAGLFWSATVALLLGMFWMPLLFLAIPLYLVLAILQVRDHRRRERALFWGAVFLSVVAVIGFVALYFAWGKLEYSLISYVILFAPVAAVFAAVALAVSYQRLRGNR